MLIKLVFMKRVLIIGSPGTGKTTFARKLALKTGLPLVHLDLYYHNKTKNYYHEINKQAWHSQVDELISQDKWIIDGNYNSTLEARVKRADTIIFFDLARRKAVTGVFKRRLVLHNKIRDDMPSYWKEHIDWKFVRYVWKFNKNKRPKIMEIISAPQNKSLIVFKNHHQAEKYLAHKNSRSN